MLKGRILATIAAATLVAGPLALAPAIPAQAATVVKATQSFSFKPGTVHVNKGAKVVWKNTCSCTHTVTATSNNWNKNTTIHSGDTTSFTFKQNGTYKYHCTIHAGMSGKVVVG
ncbi:MAG: plastocyanin/azurin family copper-binding protein [Actinomycetota bacterium]|jgi:plastocyanin